MKKLSVVTISYNEKENIGRTIESVIRFRGGNDLIEYIVIDGGSRDGTQGVIAEYEACLDFYVSESDGGIYDAMNKGINACSGEYVCFVNAGDEISYFDAERLLNSLSGNIVSFGKVFLDYKGNIIRKVPNISSLRNVYSFMPLNHQGLCVKKSIYDKVGLYSLDYKICADNEWLIRYLAHYSNKDLISFSDIVFVSMQRGGVSDVSETLPQRSKEHYRMRQAHGVGIIYNCLLTARYYFTRKLKYIVKSICFQ